MNGFDAKRFPRPSIEDIELGYRLKAAGYQTLLCKNIQVKHLKSWSLIGLLKTDIFDRALPWAELILQYRFLPNDLNLSSSQRVTTLLLLGMIFYLISSTGFANILLLFLMVGLFLSLITNWVWYQDITSFFMGQKGETRTYYLMSIICLVALFLGMNQLLLPLTILLPIHLFGRFINRSKLWRRSIFALMSTLIIAEFLLLFIGMSINAFSPLLIILTIIIILNYRLYLFLTRNRGIMFALASLPLQLFYYLYSVSAFIISGGLLIWNNFRKMNNTKKL